MKNHNGFGRKTTDVYEKFVGHVQQKDSVVVSPAYWVTARDAGMKIAGGSVRLGSFDRQGRYYSVWEEYDDHTNQKFVLCAKALTEYSTKGQKVLIEKKDDVPQYIYFFAKTEFDAAELAAKRGYQSDDLRGILSKDSPYHNVTHTYWHELGQILTQVTW